MGVFRSVHRASSHTPVPAFDYRSGQGRDGAGKAVRTSFSVGDFLSGDFQNNFELWFSTKYPHRSDFVKAYRQLRFDVSDIGFDISTAFLPKQNDTPAETEPAETDVTETDTLEETTPPEPEFTYSDFNPLYTEINHSLRAHTR